MRHQLTGALALATLAAGCGGGGGSGASSSATGAQASSATSVTVKVAGQTLGEVAYGQRGSASLHAGEAIEIEALSPVTWSVAIGSNTINGYANTINSGQGSVHETTTASSTSAWTATTSASASLANPIVFTVTAATNPPTTVTLTMTN